MTVLFRATVNYATPGWPGGGGLVGVDVDVHDGRLAQLPGWRNCGFELVQHESAISDWTDDTEIAATHYAEAEELARRLTGCDVALLSDHVKRTAADKPRPREQAPVQLAHSDFAADYAAVARTSYNGAQGRGRAALERNRISAQEVEAAERILMLQLWRNLGPATMDHPLAFCDARTLTPADVRPFHYTGYVAGGRSFDALAVTPPVTADMHRWSVFPGMRADEVAAFRTYDTDLVREGRAWFTPHTAVRDPSVPLGRAPRFSIELRVMCLFL